MAVRFTLTLLLVTFLVGTGVKAGLREMAKNDILKHPEVYKNAPPKLGMTPEEYYMKYIAPKKYPELTKPSVVVGFNALVSSVKPPLRTKFGENLSYTSSGFQEKRLFCEL